MVYKLLFKNQVEPVAVKNTMHNKPELEIDQPSPSLENITSDFMAVPRNILESGW